MFKSPSVSLFKTPIPVLNSFFCSFKIISRSAEIGAVFKVETKIDFGKSRGFAITSYGLCFINGQHPEFSRLSIISFLENFLNFVKL